MSYVTYEEIYSLDEIIVIAGGTYTMIYNVYDQSNNPINISTATLVVNIFYFGSVNATPVLAKSVVITATNQFKCILTGGDTMNLSGKFVHQPNIYLSGYNSIPAQGIITIV